MIVYKERWKEVAGYTDKYLVSTHGRVFSLPRQRRGKGNTISSCGGRYLKGTLNDGYLTVGLCKNGKSRTVGIHLLVARTFIANLENKPEVNHKDGNKTNNRADNLEWVTDLEQTQHASRMGLLKPAIGEENPNAKLTWRLVAWVRKHYIPRHPVYGQKAMSKRLGIAQSILSHVIHNKAWRVKQP